MEMNEFSQAEVLITSKEPLTRSKFFMHKVGDKMGLSKDVIRDIINPQQIVILRLPVKFWGKVFVAWGCISLHNNARGPYKGGIRIADDVDLWETVELSRLMTLKTSIADIEFGGGKTGIRVKIEDAYQMFGKDGRDIEFEKALSLDICEEFAYQAKRYLTDLTYVPAPDMGTGPEEMAYIYNQTLNPASVTGKPEGIHGWLPGRRESTGYGCCRAALRLIEEILEVKPSHAKVAIQGFGNVGANAAINLAENGVKVVAVTDIYGGIYDGEGLDIKALSEYAASNGTVKGFIDREISNEEMFDLEIDVLIPAASGNVISKKNAARISAGGIVEAANVPITYDAMEILDEKGIKIIPDIVANSGGVIASMEEYSRSLSAIKIDKDDVFKIIDEKINNSLDAVFEKSREEGTSFSEAAVQIALERVYDAMRKRRHI